MQKMQREEAKRQNVKSKTQKAKSKKKRKERRNVCRDEKGRREAEGKQKKRARSGE